MFWLTFWTLTAPGRANSYPFTQTLASILQTNVSSNDMQSFSLYMLSVMLSSVSHAIHAQDHTIHTCHAMGWISLEHGDSSKLGGVSGSEGISVASKKALFPVHSESSSTSIRVKCSGLVFVSILTGCVCSSILGLLDLKACSLSSGSSSAVEASRKTYWRSKKC